MICSKCNNKALMLFADGSCKACQPVDAVPMRVPKPPRGKRRRPIDRAPQTRKTWTREIEPHNCARCGKTIQCKPEWCPSEYKRRKYCVDKSTCYRDAARERARKVKPWNGNKKPVGENDCAAKRKGVYTRLTRTTDVRV